MQLFVILAAPPPRNPQPQWPRFENFSDGLSVFLAHESSDSRARICVRLRDCAIERYPGITLVKYTAFIIVSILADLNPDINLTKLYLYILGHKHHNFRAVDQKIKLSIKK